MDRPMLLPTRAGAPPNTPTATVELCAYLGKRRGGRMGRMEGPLWVVENDGTSKSRWSS